MKLQRPFILTTLFLIMAALNIVCAQNTMYIEGAQLQVDETAFIHVEGNLHIDSSDSGVYSGWVSNDGLIQLRGDFVFESSKVKQSANDTTAEGIVRFKNYDLAWNAILKYDTNTQSIILADGVAAIGNLAFNKVELEVDNQAGSNAADNYVDIAHLGAGGTFVEVKKTLTFNSNCRIRTDDSGFDGDDGDTYSAALYISDTLITAIVGASSTPGDISNYVEGRLYRQIAGTKVYYMPIGLAPGGFAGSDGMAAFQLSTTSATEQIIVSHVNLAQQTLGNANVYCDIGQDPSTAVNPFSDCIGGPDGISDYVSLDNEQTHEWVVVNSGIDFTYEIEVFPGAGLNATSPFSIGACGSSNYALRFLAKDGNLDGVIQAAPPPFASNGYSNGYAICPPATEVEGNKLNNQTSFSTFRIHTAVDNSSVLPVELVSFEAKASDDQSYVILDWSTVTEINNDYFEVQRSLDAENWKKIDKVKGKGNSNKISMYSVLDKEVLAGTLYYYRLKNVDFDGSEYYSDIRAVKLDSNIGRESSGVMFPNPLISEEVLNFTIYNVSDKIFKCRIFNLEGQLVGQDILNSTSTNYHYTMSMKNAGVVAGSYFIVVTDDQQNTLLNKKLMVLP